jgi:zinc/manganese transport system ATP-binding protein
MTGIPAVHHLNGEVAQGALLAVIGPERRRQVDAVSRARRHPQAAGGIDRSGRPRIATSPICRRASDIDRTFPISVFDFVRHGLWRATASSAAWPRPSPKKSPAHWPPVGLNGFEIAASARCPAAQMQRMLFAARCCCRTRALIVLDEALQRHRRRNLRLDLLALVKQLARRRRTVLAALHDLGAWCATISPETLLLARGPVAWGATEQVLTAG